MALAQFGPPMPEYRDLKEAGALQGCKRMLISERSAQYTQQHLSTGRGVRSQAVAAGNMSSPPKEKADTRAGHLPAVKAGGMRIVQKHPHATEVKEEKEKDEEDWETGASPPKPTLFISGAVARGDKDFPPAAAQVAHQKPHPSVEKLPPPQQFNQHIHQPRK